MDISASPTEYGLIRQWMTAVDCAAGDPERVRGWGGYGIAVRLVLAALGQAAMVSGSSVIEFRTRNLALHSAFPKRDPAGAPDHTRSRRFGRVAGRNATCTGVRISR